MSFDTILPDFSCLDTLSTVLLQVNVADLPHTPRLSQPHILGTVTRAGHHLIHLKFHSIYNKHIVNMYVTYMKSFRTWMEVDVAL